jgi:hypothetical protein
MIKRFSNYRCLSLLCSHRIPTPDDKWDSCFYFLRSIFGGISNETRVNTFQRQLDIRLQGMEHLELYPQTLIGRYHILHRLHRHSHSMSTCRLHESVGISPLAWYQDIQSNLPDLTCFLRCSLLPQKSSLSTNYYFFSAIQEFVKEKNERRAPRKTVRKAKDIPRIVIHCSFKIIHIHNIYD